MIDASKFHSAEMKRANLALDYYHGRQKKHLVRLMDGLAGDGGKRNQWRERGVRPFTRNITKSIIEKSGLLFQDRPKLEVYREGEDVGVVDDLLLILLDGAKWHSFFSNVDAITRLLKSSCVLTQRYVPDDVLSVDGRYTYNAGNGEALQLMMLHAANSVIESGPLCDIRELAYLIDVPSEWLDANPAYKNGAMGEIFAYRRFTNDLIEDYIAVPSASGKNRFDDVLFSVVQNNDGMIPAVLFHDTAAPMSGAGAYNYVPEDLLGLQDFLNLHLTDLEYSIAFAKSQSVVTDSEIVSSDGKPVGMGVDPNGVYSEDAYDASVTSGGGADNLGGLGSIIKLKKGLDGASTPMFEFKGPQVDLMALNSVADNLCKAIGQDWSVKLKTGGDADSSATSGFQLIVEEIDSLNLRDKRKHFFESAFRDMYKILRVQYPELSEGVLYVNFGDSKLPVDRAAEVTLWENRIALGIASRRDYFVEVHGMSVEEADAKCSEIDELSGENKGSDSDSDSDSDSSTTAES